MMEVWHLPGDSIENNGIEWLLTLLWDKSSTVRSMILMTFWRIWHVRNEIIHDKPPPALEASRRFLVSYLESIVNIKCHPTEDILKGKFIFDQEEQRIHEHKDPTGKLPMLWAPPRAGWCKLNTDGSFDNKGDAGAGMVVRDHDGNIILSACRKLQSCRDPLGAELHAIMEGLSLAIHWCNLPILVETDCLESVKMLKSEVVDRFVHAPMVEEIKTVLKVRQTCITHVNRSQNSSSHLWPIMLELMLVRLYWQRSGPDG
jgi:ribonuclease HI